MRVLNLYTTLGCHLCDEAAALVKQEHVSDLTLALVEISESAELMEKYGIRIPVLKFQAEDDEGATDACVELAWPFTEEELTIFLKDS
jgi:hypothetical protein